MGEDEYIELDEDFIVLAVPSDTVEIKISATVYVDGRLEQVEKTMGFGEVRKAIKEANDGYIPSDAVFSLRPLGVDKITALVKKYLEEEKE